MKECWWSVCKQQETATTCLYSITMMGTNIKTKIYMFHKPPCPNHYSKPTSEWFSFFISGLLRSLRRNSVGSFMCRATVTLHWTPVRPGLLSPRLLATYLTLLRTPSLRGENRSIPRLHCQALGLVVSLWRNRSLDLSRWKTPRALSAAFVGVLGAYEVDVFPGAVGQDDLAFFGEKRGGRSNAIQFSTDVWSWTTP